MVTGQHFVRFVLEQLQKRKRQNTDYRQPKREIEKECRRQPSIVGQFASSDIRLDIVEYSSLGIGRDCNGLLYDLRWASRGKSVSLRADALGLRGVGRRTAHGRIV